MTTTTPDQTGKSQINGVRQHGTKQDSTGPFALVHNEKGRLNLYALNKQAHAQSLEHGQSLADARAVVPALEVQAATPDADAAALRSLARWCTRYSPWVNIDGRDGILLDITGVAHLFGSEVALVKDLVYRLKKLNISAAPGLADGIGAASAVARYARSRKFIDRIISTQNTRAMLRPLPVEALRLDDNCIVLLKRLGLHRIGDLYDIPRTSLERRFRSKERSAHVLARLDQALGKRNEPFVPLDTTPLYRVQVSSAEGILTPEAIENGLDQLLASLCAWLERDYVGAAALTLQCYRVDGGIKQLAINTARPSREAAHFKRLLKEHLATIDPGFGIDIMALQANRVAQIGTHQPGLSGDQKRNDQITINQLVDRLANRLGKQNVVNVMPCESHLPERAQRFMTAGQRPHAPAKPRLNLRPSTHEQCDGTTNKPLRPFRLLQRPEPITVIASVPEGPPLQFTWRRVTHRVIRAQGPERIACEWWQPSARTDRQPSATQAPRDYYRIEDDEGRRYWIFRNGLYEDDGDHYAVVTNVPFHPRHEPALIKRDARDGAYAEVHPPDGMAGSSLQGEAKKISAISLPQWHMHGLFA